MTIQIWYHGGCDDGFGAAWAAYRYFNTFKPKGFGEVVYKPCFYGKPSPTYNTEDIIYIVDFSYPRALLQEIKNRCAGLWVLDHHKTAAEDLKDFPQAIFDMNRSGAVISWNFFHKINAPLLLRYVQANDLWRHDTMPNCQAVIRYIRTMPHTFEAWDTLHAEFETDMAGVFTAANAIEKYFQNMISFLAPNAQVIEFEGHRCPIINLNVVFVSEMIAKLMKIHDTQLGMAYFIDQDNTVALSFRSKGDLDCSAIAKKYGGGGHKYAAGAPITLSVLHTILTQVKESQE